MSNTYYNYRPGLGNAASYQASGTPFVSGAAALDGVISIQFPRVTKEITIYSDHNNGANDLNIYFNSDATNLNKFVKAAGSEPLTLDVKCREVWLQGGAPQAVRVYASLTGIEAKEMCILTGSGVTE